MKKGIIFIMFLLMVVSVVASDSDFSQHYMQSQAEWSYYGNVYSVNSFLFRATAPDTGLDYNSGTWGSCSVTLGGSDNGGVPITLLDSNSNYEHRSFIVTYDTQIKQYGADCSVIDTYNLDTNRTAVGKMGVIRQHRSGSDYWSPSFAVVNYNNYTSKTYMTILTLDEENSTLVLDSDVLISNTGNFTEHINIMGASGGCYSATAVSCETDNRVFGVFNADDNDIRIVSKVSGSWALDAQLDIGDNYINETLHNNVMQFTDYDADGNNEFVILGSDFTGTADVDVHMNRIQPLQILPYFYEFPDKSLTFETGASVSALDEDYQYQSLAVCQLGNVNGEKEICIDLRYESHGGDNYTSHGFINNDFTSKVVRTSSTYQSNPVFTYEKYDNDLTFESGDWMGCLYYQGGDRYSCYNETLGLIYNFTSPALATWDNADMREGLVTNIDNDEYPDLLLSNGDAYEINLTSYTASAITDWQSTFDDSYHGELMVQDISTDEKNELIYFDDTYLRIYSNDNTPFVFMNLTYEESIAGTGATTTTLIGGGATIGDTPSDATGFVNTIQDNIFVILGLFIIIALIVFVASLGVTEPVVLMIVGIIGAVISALLGLISSGILVLLIVAMVVLMLLGMTIFKKRD